MPITKQAEKKLRRDRRRALQTSPIRKNLKKIVKTVRKSPSSKALIAAYKALDKAAKHKIIHPNKAARLKSRLAKFLAKKNK